MEFLPKEDTIVNEFMLKGKKYCSLIEWKQPNHPDMFHMMLFDGDCCWIGKYTKLLSEQFRKEVGETAEEYYDNVRESLSAGDSQSAFEIKWYFSQDVIQFAWKRHFEYSGYVIHGSLPMQKNYEESQSTIIDFLLDEHAQLKDIANELERRTFDMNQELTKYTGDLDKFVSSKSALETNVYSNIVKLVSLKKQKIQQMKECLGNYNREVFSANCGEEHSIA